MCIIAKNQANESSSFRLVFFNKSSICGQIIRSSGSVALNPLTASYFCCNLRTTLVIVAWDTWRFCDCQIWLFPAARVVRTSISSGVRYASLSNSFTTTRLIRDLSIYGITPPAFCSCRWKSSATHQAECLRR